MKRKENNGSTNIVLNCPGVIISMLLWMITSGSLPISAQDRETHYDYYAGGATVSRISYPVIMYSAVDGQEKEQIPVNYNRQSRTLEIISPCNDIAYNIIDENGISILSGTLKEGFNGISLTDHLCGIYVVRIGTSDNFQYYKITI